MDKISPIAWAHRYGPSGRPNTLRDNQCDAEDDVRIVGGSAQVVALYDQAALDAAVAAERERCAAICEAISDATGASSLGAVRRAGVNVARACASIIRGA